MNPSLLPSLAWFVRIAHHRSFTRAAEEMGVSRAALSQSLKTLERQLGVRLLYRTTRDMSLTEAGQQLFDTLQPTLSQIERTVSNLSDSSSIPSGLVRINTSRLAAKALVEPHLAEFYQRYPNVGIELIMDDALSNIIADGCDVGIRVGNSLAEHVVAVPLCPGLPMLVVGAPAYFERHGVPMAPEDLSRHHCINYRFQGSGALREWDFIEPDSGRHFTLSMSGNFTTNDNESMLRSAVQGLGLIQYPEIAVAEFLLDGRLVQVLNDWTYQHQGFYLYSPAREHMPAKVRALIDFLIEKRDLMMARQTAPERPPIAH